MQPLLDEHEAAALLRLSIRTLQRRRACGVGPRYVKLGGVVRYRETDLEAHIAECLRRSTRATQEGRNADGRQ